MSRPRRIPSPGVAGIISDLPPQDIPETANVFAQDALFRRGYMEQRRGWKFDGTTADVAANLAGVWRARFTGNGNTRTVTTTLTEDIYVHNAAAAGTQIGGPNFTGAGAGPTFGFPTFRGGHYLPRCMYLDQLILCGTDGLLPVARYGGSSLAGTLSAASTWTVNEATLTGLGSGDIGAYSIALTGTAAGGRGVTAFTNVSVASGTSQTVANVRALATLAISSATVAPAVAIMYPCVSFYSAGTVSTAGGTATGFGTKWITDAGVFASTVPTAHMLLNDAGTYRMCTTGTSPASDTSSSIDFTGAVTKVAYDYCRVPTAVDAAAHKGSLFLAGGLPFRSRVYAGPPGWDPALPPGAVPPFDPTAALTSSIKSYHLLVTIDVPNPNDSDPIVAILSSPGPLIVLKRGNAYAVDGAYPDFSQRVLAAGAGCIDLRSAISLDEGQFWAGENDIYWYRGGQVVGITRGKLNREWRDLTTQGVDYCTMAISAGYLIVSIKTNGAVSTSRTWAYNLATGAWETRLSNTNPRMMFTARVAGELEQLLMVQDSQQGRVINFTKALDGTGTARDDDGTSPAMWSRSGSLTGARGDTEPLAKCLDVEVHHNIECVDGSSSTADVRVVVDEGNAATAGVMTWNTSTWNGGDSWGPGSGKAAGTISQHTGDGVQRQKFTVNRRGRSHLVEVKKTATSATEQKSEVHEYAMSMVDLSVRS